MTKPYPIAFTPTFKARIWGGSRLQSWFSDCPSNEAIGEAWVLSDHKEGQSPIANGSYQGKTLQELMTIEPTWFDSVQGHQMPDGRFPLLVKVIDAADDLSVQVHPDDEYGYAHAGEQGKTECWWVLDAEANSKLVYGHTAPSAAEFEKAVNAGAWDSLLKSVTPHTGDFFFVPSGKLHALGRGTMVLEIQQSSDTTYRVYDYDRVDASGNHRALHLKDAIAVTQYPDRAVDSQRTSVERAGRVAEQLVACPYFAVEHWTFQSTVEIDPGSLTILSVIEGEGHISGAGVEVSVHPGSQVLLPDGLGAVSVSGGLSVLATTLPRRQS